MLTSNEMRARRLYNQYLELKQFLSVIRGEALHYQNMSVVDNCNDLLNQVKNLKWGANG